MFIVDVLITAARNKKATAARTHTSPADVILSYPKFLLPSLDVVDVTTLEKIDTFEETDYRSVQEDSVSLQEERDT